MNSQQILIEIRVDLQQQALQTLSRSLSNVGNYAKSVQGGFQSMGSGIIGAVRQLTLWDSLFGRVTSAMVVWAGWRAIWRGFGFIADAIVGGNERMQTAIQTFTALSGGSKEMGQTYIDILQRLSLETGASFDLLLSNAKRLPTQVGQNFVAFTELTKKAIVLGFLDPVQGVEGAFLALTNAMEGNAAGFRSLMTRFELGNKELIKRILDETANPMEALDRIFKELNIDVDAVTKSLKSTLPVVMAGITNTFQIFFRTLGAPVLTKLTEDLGSVRDALLKNAPAVEGFGTAFGEALMGAYDRIKGFASEMFLGGGPFDPRQFLDGAINLMTSFSQGLVDGFTNYVLPAVVQIAGFIAGFFIGASPPPMGPLSQIREGGEETIKQYVLGMIAGLASADIAALAQNISDNIINLESQELAQQKSLDRLQAWVDDAAKVVQAAHDRIQLFDLQTADIPERYTRSRRRQLELESLAAQQEERRRREQVKMAQDQLQATKAYLAAQRRILTLLEQQAKAQEAAAKAAADTKTQLDMSFQPSPFDTAGAKEAAKKYAAQFREALAPLRNVWKEGFQDLGDFMRGLLGKAPRNLEVAGFPGRAFVPQLTEMFGLGGDLRTSLKTLSDGLIAIQTNVTKIFDAARAGWDGMSPEEKAAIAFIAASVIAPKAMGILGVGIELAKPGDPTGIALILGALLGGKIFNLIMQPIVLAAQGAGAALFTFLTGGGAAAGAAGAAGLGAGVLVLPVGILIAEIIFGWPELKKWVDLSAEGRLYQLGAVITLKLVPDFKTWVTDNIAMPVNTWLATQPAWVQSLLGYTSPTELQTPAVRGFGELPGDLATQGTDAGAGLMSGIGAAISGATGDLSKTVDNSIVKPVVGFFQDLYDKIVGHSIIPEMLREIVQLFKLFPFQLQPSLTVLATLMTSTMTLIKTSWITSLADMIQATILAVTAIKAELATLTPPVGSTTYAYDAASGQLVSVPAPSMTGRVPAPAGGAAGSAVAGTRGGTAISLNLDAAETRRLMEDGVYTGLLNLTGAVPA